MKTAALSLLSALTITSCAAPIAGVPVSPLTDSARIGGVVISAVDSGARPDAPAPTVAVQGTDGGTIDQLAATAVEDVETFWAGTPLPGGGEYTPVTGVVSWDSRGGEVTFCDTTFTAPNAALCNLDNSMGWDRGGLMPTLVQSTGDLGAALIVAHEIGHFVDLQTRRDNPPTIVKEQRADCYAGAYTAWVAEGSSQRFSVSPEGLDLMLEVLPIAADVPDVDGDHGNSVERLWAFQHGFMAGVDACAAIDMSVVQAHREGWSHQVATRT